MLACGSHLANLVETVTILTSKSCTQEYCSLSQDEEKKWCN